MTPSTVRVFKALVAAGMCHRSLTDGVRCRVVNITGLPTRCHEQSLSFAVRVVHRRSCKGAAARWGHVLVDTSLTPNWAGVALLSIQYNVIDGYLR